MTIRKDERGRKIDDDGNLMPPHRKMGKKNVEPEPDTEAQLERYYYERRERQKQAEKQNRVGKWPFNRGSDIIKKRRIGK